MNSNTVKSFLFLVVVVMLTCASFFLGERYLATSARNPTDIHNLMHKKLGITQEQDKALHDIEAKYSKQKNELEERILDENRALGEAIKQDKSNSARVQKAAHDINKSMGELQKVTLEHLFEMQTVLTSEQNEKLNGMIADALAHKE